MELLDLNEDCLLEIMDWLDIRSLCAAQLTCRDLAVHAKPKKAALAKSIQRLSISNFPPPEIEETLTTEYYNFLCVATDRWGAVAFPAKHSFHDILGGLAALGARPDSIEILGQSMEDEKEEDEEERKAKEEEAKHPPPEPTELEQQLFDDYWRRGIEEGGLGQRLDLERLEEVFQTYGLRPRALVISNVVLGLAIDLLHFLDRNGKNLEILVLEGSLESMEDLVDYDSVMEANQNFADGLSLPDLHHLVVTAKDYGDFLFHPVWLSKWAPQLHSLRLSLPTSHIQYSEHFLIEAHRLASKHGNQIPTFLEICSVEKEGEHGFLNLQRPHIPDPAKLYAQPRLFSRNYWT